jgi:hypothetical protein
LSLELLLLLTGVVSTAWLFPLLWPLLMGALWPLLPLLLSLGKMSAATNAL